MDSTVRHFWEEHSRDFTIGAAVLTGMITVIAFISFVSQLTR
jgi:hypothetical protein